MNEKELLEELINRSLERLYKDDLDLINRSTNERTLTARFMLYFENYFKESKYDIFRNDTTLNTDVEYNRNGKGPKRLNDGTNNYPDFILHKRKSNNYNILIIEFKTHWNEDQSEDIKKIQGFMSDDDKFKYRYGATIMLGKDKPLLRWIEKRV